VLILCGLNIELLNLHVVYFGCCLTWNIVRLWLNFWFDKFSFSLPNSRFMLFGFLW